MLNFPLIKLLLLQLLRHNTFAAIRWFWLLAKYAVAEKNKKL
jgi:hypothetical protein